MPPWWTWTSAHSCIHAHVPLPNRPQEATRTLAASLGAELMLVPNACAIKPEQLLQLSTRAAENILAVAM